MLAEKKWVKRVALAGAVAAALVGAGVTVAQAAEGRPFYGPVDWAWNSDLRDSCKNDPGGPEPQILWSEYYTENGVSMVRGEYICTTP